MSRRYRKSRVGHTAPELDITSFLNLMVVLIPFLLISAVFSRVAIMELTIPTDAGGAAVNTPTFNIEVIVRKAGLEIANGVSVEETLPIVEGKYDIQKLTEKLTRLKETYPEKDDATVLLEPDIEYDYLIQVMDAVRGFQVMPVGSDTPSKFVLFPNISIGDAP